jgi:hypothetical protein
VFTSEDGRLWVRGSPLSDRRPHGISFLELCDEVAEVHASFIGQCKVTVPREVLSEGFSMECVHNFNWSRQEDHPKQVVGSHYHLIPRIDMPMNDYTAEASRIAAVDCTFRAAGEPTDLFSHIPGDYLMALIVDALKDMYNDIGSCLPDDQTDCVLAYLYAAEICCSDMLYDDLARDAVLIDLSSEAVKRHSAKLRQLGELRADPVLDSDYCNLLQDLEKSRIMLGSQLLAMDAVDNPR